MSDYYNAQRTRNLDDPKSSTPFKLSRSKIDLFIECPRCFYFDRKIGVARPPGFPFALNSAVDTLLKKEFDEGVLHSLRPVYIEFFFEQGIHRAVQGEGEPWWSCYADFPVEIKTSRAFDEQVNLRPAQFKGR